MKQITDAVRVQMINWPWRYVWPLGLLVVVWVLNLAIFGLLNDVIPAGSVVITGGIVPAYITAGVVYLVALTQTFAFAIGFGVTRRAYYAAVLLLIMVESMAYGTLMLLLCLVERATGGWGVRLPFFDLQFVRQTDLLLQWVVYTVPLLALGAGFAFIGVVYKRWSQAGVWTLVLGSTVLIGGLAVLVTWFRWWPAVVGWLVMQPSSALFGGYPLLLAVAVLGFGWLALRRATP